MFEVLKSLGQPPLELLKELMNMVSFAALLNEVPLSPYQRWLLTFFCLLYYFTGYRG